MMRFAACLAVVTLAACSGAPSGSNPGAVRAVSAAGGTCPSPDPSRDGPLVDAIRRGDSAFIQTALARDPSDARAQAALILASGRGRPDLDQAACFAPYLATG